MKSKRKNISSSLEYLTISQLAESIRSQRLSPVEVVDACCQRIEGLHPKLNAFITILADEARAQAREAEARAKSGAPQKGFFKQLLGDAAPEARRLEFEATVPSEFVPAEYGG